MKKRNTKLASPPPPPTGTPRCWFCDGLEPDAPLEVEHVTPNGTPCKPHTVNIHFACLFDIKA